MLSFSLFIKWRVQGVQLCACLHVLELSSDRCIFEGACGYLVPFPVDTTLLSSKNIILKYSVIAISQGKDSKIDLSASQAIFFRVIASCPRTFKAHDISQLQRINVLLPVGPWLSNMAVVSLEWLADPL